MSLDQIRSEVLEKNTIPDELYTKFDVKRGLRNADGSGVLAGLSKVSSVIGSEKQEGQTVPVEGRLSYRGLPIADVLTQLDPYSPFGFEALIFFLIVGRMPSGSEFESLKTYIEEEKVLPAPILEHCIKGIPSKSVMNKLQTALSALYAFDADADSTDAFQNFLKSVAVIAKLPAIIAYSYLSAYVPNATYITPPKGASLAETFLIILNQGKPVPASDVKVLDLCLLLHAEHGGGNNSAFATYVVSSSQSDIYSTLAAAVASLKGPLHGAANQKVMTMMDDIKSNVKEWSNHAEVDAYLRKILTKSAGDKSGKIYGLGHAVYTKSDPRAIELLKFARQFAKEKNRESELDLYLYIAKRGGEIFQEIKGSDKVIAPNVDFFSGFVYDCLGFPEPLYTPIFGFARCLGWCAHRIEELLSGKRIIRPGYKYVG